MHNIKPQNYVYQNLSVKYVSFLSEIVFWLSEDSVKPL